MHARTPLRTLVVALPLVFGAAAGCTENPAGDGLGPAVRSPFPPPYAPKYLVNLLSSADEGQVLEGQVGLILTGREALDMMDARAEDGTDEVRRRLRSVLRLGMFSTMDHRTVERHPVLWSLIHEDVERGHTLAQALAARDEFAVVEPGCSELGAPEEVRQTLESLRAL
jgi:hypothetical protein